MSRLFFSGVVLPERAVLSVSEVKAQIHGPDGKPLALLTLNIYNNQISVVVDSDEPSIYTLRNVVRSECEDIVNIAGFILGHAYDIEITKAFSETLTPTQVFGVHIPALSERANGRDLNALVNAVLPLCNGVDGAFLRRCLADLSFAIKRPEDTAFHCFRALESLRQSFGSDLPESEQWRAMSQAVGSSKTEMEPLRTRAFPARHGVPPPTSDEERKEFFLYAWKIVERYLDYRLKSSGRAPIFGS